MNNGKKDYMFRRLINIKKSLYFIFIKKTKELNVSKKVLLNAIMRFGLDNIDIVKKNYITKDLLDKKQYCIKIYLKVRNIFNDELDNYCAINNITKTDLVNKIIDIIIKNKDFLIKKQNNKPYVYASGKKNVKLNECLSILVDKTKYEEFYNLVTQRLKSKKFINTLIRNYMFDYIRGNL